MWKILCFSAVLLLLPGLIAPAALAQTGACCMEDGPCFVLTFYECIATEHACEWLEGAVCVPNPCGG